MKRSVNSIKKSMPTPMPSMMMKEQCLQQNSSVNEIMAANQLSQPSQLCKQLHQQPQPQKIKIKQPYSIKEIVKEQLFDGSWKSQQIILELFKSEVLTEIKKYKNVNAAITYLILIWIQKNHPQKQYSLIVKKARNWLKKQQGTSQLPSLFDQYLK